MLSEILAVPLIPIYLPPLIITWCTIPGASSLASWHVDLPSVSDPPVNLVTYLWASPSPHMRYDGGHKLDRYLTDTLGQYVEYVPVCPEVECGLTVPREAMRLVGRAERQGLSR